MRVETVRGAMAVDGLRTTLMHEHVFVPTPDVMQNYGHEWWDEQDRVPGAVRQTAGAQGRRRRQHRRPDRGGLGRSIPRVQRVNEQVDINIIVATGLYTLDEIPHFFHYRGPGAILDGPELMTEMFVNDIRHGIGGTEVRAAFLKGVVEERGLTAMLVHNRARYFTGGQE